MPPPTPCRHCGVVLAGRPPGSRCQACGKPKTGSGLGRGNHSPNRVASSRVAIVTFRSEHPAATLKIIGQAFGLTRERVRQVLKRAGVATRGVTVRRTVPCYECARCHRTFRPYASLRLRIAAGRSQPPTYCPQCYHETRRVQVPCDECGAPVVRAVSNIIWKSRGESPAARRYHGRFFCNGVCRGRYMGKHYGWGSPEHPIQLLVDKTCLDCGTLFTSVPWAKRCPSCRAQHPRRHFDRAKPCLQCGQPTYRHARLCWACKPRPGQRQYQRRTPLTAPCKRCGTQTPINAGKAANLKRYGTLYCGPCGSWVRQHRPPRVRKKPNQCADCGVPTGWKRCRRCHLRFASTFRSYLNGTAAQKG